jgi:methyl-accepting chemotaxis protein
MSTVGAARQLSLREPDIPDADLRAELETYRETIRQVAAVCEAAARGDLEPRILHIHADGELGVMLRSINHLLDMTDAFVREAGASLTHAAEEKFYRRVLTRGMLGSFRQGADLINAAIETSAKLAAARSDRMHLSDEFENVVNEVVQKVASAAAGTEATARTLMDSAEKAGHQSARTSGVAAEASENMATVASGTEVVSNSATAIEQQAMQSSQVADRAMNEVERTHDVIQRLTSASNDISRMVALITRVANQTRLLALNAAIEAAHAGEAGKGFAVVAAEVKNLSQQTAGAMKEINDSVVSIQSATEQAVQATTGIADTVKQMHGFSGAVREAAGEQRVATQEMQASVRRATTGTHEVAENVAATAAGTQATREAADQMVASAAELSELAGALRSHVAEFLFKIRSDGDHRAEAATG